MLFRSLVMMPQTVPKRPMKGPAEPTVASTRSRRSSRSTSRAMVTSNRRLAKAREVMPFEPRPMETGPGWRVRVTWPDGEVEYIPGFQTEAEAKEWIETKSRQWLYNQFGTRRAVNPEKQ